MPFTRGLHNSATLSRLLSGVLLGLQVVFAVLHASTGLSLRGIPVQQTQLVRLTDLNWWWLVAFGVTAIALAVTWVTGRYRQHAHAVAGAIWAMYAVELWFAAFAPHPLLPLAWPVAATALAVVYGLVGGALAEQADVVARGER